MTPNKGGKRYETTSKDKLEGQAQASARCKPGLHLEPHRIESRATGREVWQCHNCGDIWSHEAP